MDNSKILKWIKLKGYKESRLRYDLKNHKCLVMTRERQRIHVVWKGKVLRERLLPGIGRHSEKRYKKENCLLKHNYLKNLIMPSNSLYANLKMVRKHFCHFNNLSDFIELWSSFYKCMLMLCFHSPSITWTFKTSDLTSFLY